VHMPRQIMTDRTIGPSSKRKWRRIVYHLPVCELSRGFKFEFGELLKQWARYPLQLRPTTSNRSGPSIPSSIALFTPRIAICKGSLIGVPTIRVVGRRFERSMKTDRVRKAG